MSARIRQTKNLENSGFFDFVERYWIVILGLLIGIPFMYRYFYDADTKNEVNEVEEAIKLNNAVNLTPQTQLKALQKITVNQGYHTWAWKIANALGTLQLNQNKWYDFLRPSTWTENDADAYQLLKQVTNTGQKKVLSELYFTLTARNLQTDVLNLLDKDERMKLTLF